MAEELRGGAATLEEWGRKEAARCDGGDPDIELCELPEVIDAMPPAERSAAEEAWSRGRCAGSASGASARCCRRCSRLSQLPLDLDPCCPRLAACAPAAGCWACWCCSR